MFEYHEATSPMTPMPGSNLYHIAYGLGQGCIHSIIVAHVEQYYSLLHHYEQYYLLLHHYEIISLSPEYLVTRNRTVILVSPLLAGKEASLYASRLS